jgi:hypothetical protein
MSTLPVAIEMAAHWHGQQKDRGGQWYILHPISVMMKCKSEKAKIVGVLHDILEDTDCKEKHLREAGFDNDVIDGIKSVTHLPGEMYSEGIVRAYNNMLGRDVKIHDLEENSNVLRLPCPLTDKDAKRMSKYAISYAFLIDNMTLEEFIMYANFFGF